MDTKILIKYSTEKGKIPKSEDLELGELALNVTDGCIYFKDTNNKIRRIKQVKATTLAIKKKPNKIRCFLEILVCFWVAFSIVSYINSHFSIDIKYTPVEQFKESTAREISGFIRWNTQEP